MAPIIFILIAVLIGLILSFYYFHISEVAHKNKERELSLDLDLAFQANNTYVWRFDVKTQIFTFLRGTINGKSSLTFQRSGEVMHPDDQILHQCIYEDLISGRKNNIDINIRCLINGEYRTLKTIMTSKYKNGKVYEIIGSFLDITESLKKEEEINELLYQNKIILDNINCGLLYLDKKYNTIWQNQNNNPIAFCKRCQELGNYDCKECSVFKCVQTKAIETSIRCQDDKTFEITGIPISREGNNVGTVVRLEDITIREKAIQDIKEAKRKAENADNLKTSFLANISHEIRTPLNAIVGFSDLLLNTEEKSDKELYCNIIKENNDQLLVLINDLIDMSQIESGNMEFEKKDFDIESLLDSIYESYIPRFENKPIELIFKHHQGESYIIKNDSGRIREIISSFMNNALKYTNQGSVTLWYEIKEKSIRLCVSDTGIGIAKENQEKIFDRFFKLNSFVKGNGLGLSIASTIVKAIGGEIGVNSELGKGSTFWISLPF